MSANLQYDELQNKLQAAENLAAAQSRIINCREKELETTKQSLRNAEQRISELELQLKETDRAFRLPPEVDNSLTQAQNFGGSSVDVNPIETRAEVRKYFVHWAESFSQRYIALNKRPCLADNPAFQRMVKLSFELFVLPATLLVTPIWCVYRNGCWYWSPYQAAICELDDIAVELGTNSSQWMPVTTMVVREGHYRGEKPVRFNITVLQALDQINPMPSMDFGTQLAPTFLTRAMQVIDGHILPNFPYSRKITMVELDGWVSTNPMLTSLGNFIIYFTNYTVWIQKVNDFLDSARAADA
jgi:hypothetical protein